MAVVEDLTKFEVGTLLRPSPGHRPGFSRTVTRDTAGPLTSDMSSESHSYFFQKFLFMLPAAAVQRK